MSATPALDYRSVLVLALGLSRTASAFVLLPVLSADVAPALVRNSLFVGMGVIVLVLQPAAGFEHLTAMGWIAAFLGEVFIGLTVGFFFAGVLWSLEMAGDFIDQKVNNLRFTLSDPFSGTSGGVYGGFFSRLAVFAFAASGGLIYVVAVLLQSYAIWPIGATGLHLHPEDMNIFERVFADLVVLALMFSAPALVLSTLLDAVMGLINRLASQFNVFSLSMALKMWFSALAVSITAAMLADQFAGSVFKRGAAVVGFLQHHLG